MKKAIILLDACFALMFSDLVYSQPALINPHPFFFKNQTAFYLNGSLEAAEDKVIGADVGIVINRMIDLGLGVGRLTSNDQLAQALEVSALHVSPHLTFFPISQSDIFPLTVGITAGYSHIGFSSPLLQQAELQISASDMTFQINTFSGIEIDATSVIVVGGSVAYLSRSLKTTFIKMQEKITQTEVAFNFHTGARFNTSPKNYFYLGSKLTVIGDITSFSLTAGIGFGKSKTSGFRSPSTSTQRAKDLDDLIEIDDFTRFPNFRSAKPDANKYSDEEILQMFREKFPSLRNKSDEELIRLIENKHKGKH